jgi:hypothetical protein
MSVTLKARSQTLRGAPARFRLDVHRELVPGVLYGTCGNPT